ncbi:MAG: mRNA surveillance protein pelota [Nanoarchaeota archaeon]
MRILHKDLKQGKVKIRVDNLDDLWYLSAIIEENDHVAGPTERKIKVGSGGTDKSQQVIRKIVFIELKVEKVEFHKYANILRVSGKITGGPEDVQRGTYHTFNVEQETEITIRKEQWLKYQLGKLKEAAETKQAKVLLCLVDREEAFFAVMKRYGYEFLLEMKGEVQKKASPEKVKATFYQDVVKQLEEYDKRYELDKIIVASPGFWKEYLQEEIKNKTIAKKVILATCSDVSKAGFEEVLKRPETRSALKDDNIVREINLVDDVMKEIVKDGVATYGFKETAKAAENGAVSELLVTDALIQKMRQENTFGKLDRIMRIVDQANGNVHIVSAEHEGGKKLDGLGGIAAILRYKMNW